MSDLHSTLAITCNGDPPESKIWVETVVEIGPADGEAFQTTITPPPRSTDPAVSRNIRHYSLFILIFDD
jgi:hypothetical protein